jgi:hypothetical protein
MSLIIENRNCRWPDLKVPYEIPESSFPKGSKERQNIIDAIRHINSQTRVRLFDRGGRSDLCDYIQYRLSQNLDSSGNALTCNSSVGRQGGRQFINCDAGSVGTVVHETCHAIGLRHEQQRPDRDDFIKVDLEKNPKGLSESNYDKRDDLMFGAYDQSSIMQYRTAAITSRNGKPLGNSRLSPGDIKALDSMLTSGYLTKETDASSAPVIRVQSLGGEVKVAKGDFRKIVVPSNRFWWYSGSSREWTTASPGTNVLTVYRKRDNRDILWFCHQDPSVKIPKRRFLGNEHDKCGEPSLKVFGVEGAVKVAKGTTVEVHITDRHFRWRCGDSNEKSVAPEGTNLLVVTRASAGRDITWGCYREG